MNESLHKAAFLGPKGENLDELEQLLLEVLRDHVFWRRNFHPSDPRLIAEHDKRSEAFTQMTAQMRDELFKILSELKRAAPLYSPRQVAHIVSDPTLPALIGYFAGLLYNQNNVVEEVSPETVREERAYFRALAHMVGYPDFLPETLPPKARARRQPFSWGHLCSGGTVANLEALWMARNVRLYPLSVRLVGETHADFAHMARMEVTTAQGDTAQLEELSTFALSNLPIGEITDLHLRIKAQLAEADRATAQAFQEAIPSVRTAGLASFLLSYNQTFPEDPARLPKVLISQAAHYCWKKNLDVIGLGADALETVPTDDRIRMDMEALTEQVRTYAENRQPVLGVVSICGTTEEGAVDPLHKIEAFREEVAAHGLTFWHHCDAAFGGYFAAMLPKDQNGDVVPYDDVDDTDLNGPDALVDADVYNGIAAMAQADSITIDPHKFGYIPYPAGAVLFRDYHVRDAISYAAPYLADDDRSGFGGFLGQWTLEGSRPGAAAVSCYLSQAMVPLTPEGHGQLMKNCIAVNQALVEAMHARFPSGESWIELRPLAAPDTVGYCFVLMPQSGFDSIAALNAYTERIWKRMTVDGREDINQYDFLVSKTEVEADAYEHVLEGVLPESLLRDALHTDASLTLLRTCLMNPFLTDWSQHDPPFADQLATFLHNIALDEHLSDVLPALPVSDSERLHIAVVEPDPTAPDALAEQLSTHEKGAAHLSIAPRHPAASRPTDAWTGYDAVVLPAHALSEASMQQTARRVHGAGVPLFVLGDAEAAASLDRHAELEGVAFHRIIHDTFEQQIRHLLARLHAEDRPAVAVR